jgi:hypothetical protein
MADGQYRPASRGALPNQTVRAFALNRKALPGDDLTGGVVRGDHEYVCVEGGRGTENAGATDKSPFISPSREFQVAADSRGVVDCHIAVKGGGIKAGRLRR